MIDENRVTASGRPPESSDIPGAPAPINPETGQHKDHWVLSEAERAKGFIRPVRVSYLHTVCGTITSMGLAIAETYARNPQFYGKTFCCQCVEYLPVGEAGNFIWRDDSTKVGT